MSLPRRASLAVLASVFGAGFLALHALAGEPAAEAAGPAAKAVTVHVKLLDFRFVLSRKQVPAGAVRFVVVNRGAAPHDFRIAGKRTKVLKKGQRQVLTVRFRKAGRYAYVCTVPGHTLLGMKGTLIVGKPGAGKTSPPAPAPGATTTPTSPVTATEIGRFDGPVHVAAPPGDRRRLFVVEKAGRIRVVKDGVVLPQSFLDIRSKVRSTAAETGLQSMAFAPDYAESGRVYVVYNDRVGNGNWNLVEYRRHPLNPDVADEGRLVLHIEKPYENHNAGMLQFGTDGYLYVSIGDGDSGVRHPPGAFAQTRDDLLGNILRIDPREKGDAPYSVPRTNPFVGVPGAYGEIWAYGLRNPWRFWLDRPTGDLYIADVALGGPEEINWIPGGGRGGWNFGWPCFEGSRPFDTARSCPDAIPPVFEYAHTKGECSVIGGVTMHDPRLPAHEGRYLWSDFCIGDVRSLKMVDGKATDDRSLGLTVPGIVSFGEDALGRTYAVSLHGPVYRIDPAG